MEEYQIKKKTNLLILLLISFFILFNPVNAENYDLTSEKYILYNMNDETILDAKDENEKTYIASLTKIMTVLVSLDYIKDYDEKITFTNDMLKDIAWDVQTCHFSVGSKYTYNDLLYCSILHSGADGVNALAISTSGSIDKFVSLMNEKVKELNLKNTNFENPIGITDEDNYSSAYDVAQILIQALKNDKFKEVFTAKSYTLSNGKKLTSTISSYNNNKNNISFITGAKTGYTSASGYCLATTATIDNVNYLLVTLNSHSSNAPHIKDAIEIYNYYGNNYGYKNIVNEEDVIVTLKSKSTEEKEVDIHSNISLDKYLKNDFDKSKIAYNYSGDNYVTYFTKKGTTLGHVKIEYNNEILDEFDLVFNETLHFSMLSFLINHKILTTILIIILLLIARIIQVQIINRSRRKRKLNRIKR